MKFLLLALSFILVPLSSFAAVNASQTLILQTGGTERVRINASGIVTASISATEVSTTVLKWGTRTPPTCNTAAKGQMLYTTSTTAPLQFCDGSAWRVITLDGGSPIVCLGGSPLDANTCRYAEEGEYQFTLPANRSMYALVWGAGGGAGSYDNGFPDSDGGPGGFSTGEIPAAASDRTFRLIVGSGGRAYQTTGCWGAQSSYGGGGVGTNIGGNGGGYSAIFLGTASQANTIIMAGGGGGGGSNANTRQGGSGGGLSGANGASGGGGGTQSAAGSQSGTATQAAGALQGGVIDNQVGGGGGYYGGGGAVSTSGGGGGGSGYLGAGLLDTYTSVGSGRNPDATANPFYYASAGQGGLGQNNTGNVNSCGKPGLIVLLAN